MKSEAQELIKNHPKLTHTDNIKVVSHVQREENEWFVNTLMLEDINVPFKYKRKKLYQSLKGNRINITYYATNENVAGMEFETMNIVRIKIS